MQFAPWDILVQLVQIGGIGGTLAFLLLGFYLLWKEQDKKDAQGNPVAPNQLTIDAIYRFLKYALVFFFVGIAAQVAMLYTQDTLRRWNQPAMSQLLFDRWRFIASGKRLSIAFSEAGFEDAPVVPKSQRGAYQVYVGVRAKPQAGPLAGAYPILFGPFSFGSVRELEKALSEEEFTALGGGAAGSCVQFVLFGVDKETQVSAPFSPASHASAPIVFNNVFSCSPS